MICISEKDDLFRERRKKKDVLQEPKVIISVAGRSSSATLLEAELVNDTARAAELVPAVFEGLTAEVGPFKCAGAERDELEVIRLDDERRARGLGDRLCAVDEDRAVRGRGGLRRHVLAVADN